MNLPKDNYKNQIINDGNGSKLNLESIHFRNFNVKYGTMKKLFSLLLLLLLVVACKTAPEKESDSTTQEVVTLPSLPDSISFFFNEKVQDFAKLSHYRVMLKVEKDGEMASYFGYDGRGDSLITDFSTPVEIGSASKMFTAAAVLQLIEEGKTTLETPFTQILPGDTLYDGLAVVDGVNYIDSIKVRNLLNHTSGMPDYFIEGSDSLEIEKNADPNLHFSLVDLIARSKRSTQERFVPGSKFEYSNINYILLGEIIHKLSGQTYQDYVQEHILNPLGMNHTYFGTTNPPAKQTLGHHTGKVVQMPYSMAGSAGEIIATLDDMILFIDALYEGRLYKNPETNKMQLNEYYQDMGMGRHYGLGIININNSSWGHAGQTFGLQSYTAAVPNGYRFTISIDDSAGGSVWLPAMSFSTKLNMQ